MEWGVGTEGESQGSKGEAEARLGWRVIHTTKYYKQETRLKMVQCKNTFRIFILTDADLRELKIEDYNLHRGRTIYCPTN